MVLTEQTLLLTAQVLLTIATLGYSVIPTMFDFNESHATNPSWTGHARYHVVWQVSSYDYIAILSLVLIWTAGADVKQLWIAALLALAAYGGFWTAYLTQSVYGGVLQDKVNGVPRFYYNILGWKFSADANVSLFMPLFIITLLAIGVLSRIPFLP